MDKISRRGLFRALPSLISESVKPVEKEEEKSEKPLLVRPPYLSENSDFSLCKKCAGDCVFSCEENILFRHEDGSPYISFKKSGCTFCGNCLSACQKGVLNNPSNKKVYGETVIDTQRCLSWNGTMCFSCKDPCIDDAIKFQGLFKPIILSDKCTNCGFCLIYCPVDAILIRGLS